MDIIFPRFNIDVGASERGWLTLPRNYIGNPKAIAAQTFKSKQAGQMLFSVKPWADFSSLFTVQSSIENGVAPMISTPSDQTWIMYPYTCDEIPHDRACLIWREPVEPRWLRHLRVYRDEDAALQDNDLIARSIKASLGLD